MIINIIYKKQKSFINLFDFLYIKYIIYIFFFYKNKKNLLYILSNIKIINIYIYKL